MNDIFNALRYTDYHAVKAVIIGQDPYHGENQAHGLSFSVKDGVPPPPSLVNKLPSPAKRGLSALAQPALPLMKAPKPASAPQMR